MALLTSVDAAHWETWLTSPVQFAAALDLVAQRARGAPLCALQTGPHPVLDGAVTALGATAGVQLVAQAASLRRKVPALAFIRQQRAALAAAGVLAPALRAALSRPGALQVEAGSRKVTLELGAPFPEQGLASAHYPALARRLALFFPGLKPHDLYRFTSVAALLEGWDAAPDAAAAAPTLGAHATAALEILGSGVRLPPCVRSAQACWDALSAETCAIDDCPIEGFKASPSGFLQPPFSKADIKAACADPKLAVSPPEANCMDPQQALALQLVDELWKDVGEAVTAAVLSNRERVGVYIGAWQPPGFLGKSAYAALGATLSALAARVANSYDLQGPALTLNTACSSSLVAVDCALKDARAGRIDFAIVGGINLIAGPGGEQQFADLKRATMLSPTFRCHTFSEAADGYVRAEGGVLFLLRSTTAPPLPEGAPTPSARIVGAAVNQNSQRRPMTAVDPIAQERVVRAACADAGLLPSALDAIEMHGTGTKLGDPVELSALARVTAAAPSSGEAAAPKPCVVTAAKMHFGHLESAAGALGLLKVSLMLQKRAVPGFAVDAPGLNPNVAPSFDPASGSRLVLPGAAGAPLPDDALIGVSSFGFAGNNGHVILQAYSAETAAAPAAPAAPAVVAPVVRVRRPSTGAVRVPTRVAAAAPKAAPKAVPKVSAPPPRAVAAVSSASAIKVVWRLCVAISDGSDAEPDAEPDDPEASLFDMGLDSLGLAELVIQLEEVYGEGCLSVDDILAAPTLGEVASLLPSRPPTPANDDMGSPDRLAASFVSDLSDRKGVRNSGGAALWRVRNSGNVPWPPGTQITIGGDDGDVYGGLPTCNLHVPSSRAAAVLPGEEVDVDVADLHEAAPTVTVKSGPLFTAAAPPSSAVRVPPKPAANAFAKTPAWTKGARVTPAAAATPVVGTPVANGPLDTGVSAAVVERLAKMEAESRELRDLVLTLATSPGGLDFGA